MYYYHNGGFLVDDIHTIPPDAIALTDGEYQDLMVGQAGGMEITTGPDGRPVLEKPPGLSPEDIRVAMEKKRALAYQAESDPLYFKWKRGEATEEDWLEKIQEIKDRYPIEVGE